MRLALVLLLLVTACSKRPSAIDAGSGHVGSASCARCHASQFDAWRSSNHAQAEEVAPDGGIWLGVTPVRQLAIADDAGRFQVLPLGFRDDGGEFSLQGELDSTAPQFAWGEGCAPCHDTAVRVHTVAGVQFTERGVGCEACHGPGAAHVAANGQGALWPSLKVRNHFVFATDAGVAALDGVPTRDVQSDRCAGCHTQRRALRDDGVTGPEFLDAFEPMLLDATNFHPDGRVKGEVYEVASFAMSKMQRAGVRCSHCHEPHSGRLRSEGDALCKQCHAPKHVTPLSGGTCVSCHMPTTTFLALDVRHDHAFPVPGREAGTCLSKAFGGEIGAAPCLEAIADDASQSTFLRASALRLLAQSDAHALDGAISRAAHSDQPLLRYAAAASLDRSSAGSLADRLLRDERRAVRVAAARALKRSTPELIASELANQWRGEAWLNLGRVAAETDRDALYRRGLEADPSFGPLHLALKQPQNIAVDSPWRPDALQAVALKDTSHALPLLDEAVRLAPERADLAWLRLVAVQSAGRAGDARRELRTALQRHPRNRRLLLLEVLWLRDAKDFDATRAALAPLLAAEPDAPDFRSLAAELNGR